MSVSALDSFLEPTYFNPHDMAKSGQEEPQDLVLSKHEYQLLQAFHRKCPIPALQCGATRLVCDEELEIPELEMPEFKSTSSSTIVDEKQQLSTFVEIEEDIRWERPMAKQPYARKGKQPVVVQELKTYPLKDLPVRRTPRRSS